MTDPTAALAIATAAQAHALLAQSAAEVRNVNLHQEHTRQARAWLGLLDVDAARDLLADTRRVLAADDLARRIGRPDPLEVPGVTMDHDQVAGIAAVLARFLPGVNLDDLIRNVHREGARILHEAALTASWSVTHTTLAVAHERDRQRTQEGWDTHHDLGHPAGTLLAAGACYLSIVHQGSDGRLAVHTDPPVPADWPFDPAWWKPSPDPIRNLVKGAALVIAEGDRDHHRAIEEGT